MFYIWGVCWLGWFTPVADAANQSVTYDAEGNLTSEATNAATVGASIVVAPAGKLAQIGGTVSLSVVAAGTGPLTYQWRFNNSDIALGTNPSAGTSTLILSNLGSGDFGNYSVRVSNGSGTVTSTTAALQLDSVGDGIPDSWKVANFGSAWASNVNATASADADGDGFTNAEEYADGTDPNNATSHFYRLTAVGNVLVQPTASRYAPGTVVTLTGQTQGDLQFSGWSTQDTIANTAPVISSANPLVLTMNTNYAATALYGTLPLENVPLVPSFTISFNARAESFLVQTDGKLVVGGGFDFAAGVVHRSLARFNTDGTLDASFNAVTDSSVVSMVQQADGKLLIAGGFGTVNGASRSGVARLNPDGTLDTTFTANCNNTVRQVLYRASDGLILICGGFNQVNGTTSSGLARLNPNGSLDNAFAIGAGANQTVYGMAWLPNGQVVIGGDFDNFNGTSLSRLARLNANGSVDATFLATASSTVYRIARRPSDGDLWVAGNFGTIDGVARHCIARLRASDGSFDPSVNLGIGVDANGINAGGLVLQADGKVVIGGNFSGVNGGVGQALLTRLNADGSVDTSYTFGGTGLDNPVVAVGLDASGNTMVGGFFSFLNGSPRIGVARLRASDGNPDPAYNVNLSIFQQSYAVASQPNGAMIVGGPFNVVNGVYRPYVARLNADGTLDTAFNSGSGPSGAVSTVAVGADGKVVIGGVFDFVDGHPSSGVGRFNADGTLDSTFQLNNHTTGTVDTLAIQRDGKIVAGGDFTQLNGLQRQHLGRLNADGSIDTAFVPVVDATVNSVVVQADARIVVGGNFNGVNGVATSGLARLNPDGTLDSSFTLQLPNNNVYALAVQPDGRLLVGGRFNTLLGSNVLATRIARLNSDGTVDPSFHLGGIYGISGDVLSLAVQSDGHLVVGGDFASVNGTNDFAITRLNSDGSLDTSAAFTQSTTQPDARVYGVAVQPSGAVLAAGLFKSIGGQSRPGFARFVTAPTLQPGAITVSPVGPNYGSGASVTLSLTPVSTGATISGVSFESSADGVQFQFLGTGLPGAGGAWTCTVSSLPPGASYFRAVVTDSAAELARSNAVGPLFTPPGMSAASATGYAGLPFTFTTTAMNSLTGFTASGLPAWATASFDANLGQLLISGTPNAPGTSAVSLRPANSAGSTSAPLTLTIYNRFDSWAANGFTALELNNPNLSGPLGDATASGVSNLTRYALGLAPHQSPFLGLPVAGLQTFGGLKYLTLTYTHDPTAADVTLTVKITGDLTQPWTFGPGNTLEVSRTPNGNGTETVVTRDLVPAVSANQRYIHLEITLLP